MKTAFVNQFVFEFNFTCKYLTSFLHHVIPAVCLSKDSPKYLLLDGPIIFILFAACMKQINKIYNFKESCVACFPLLTENMLEVVVLQESTENQLCHVTEC